MIRRFLLLTLLLGALAARPVEDRAARAEKAMQDRPAEALRIAREAAADLADQPQKARALFRIAVQLQEERLGQLSEAQVNDLADVHTRELGDAEAALRVRRAWLTVRRLALGPKDAPGRLELARLTLRWLKDAEAAAHLTREAWHLAADPASAARMMKEANLSAAEVRQLLGPPLRISRQILNRRCLEQWTYDDPATRIEFDCPRGREPQLLSVQNLPSGKS